MARNNGIRKGTGKKVYAILVDGETEKWYLQLMKQHESIPVDIKPDLHKKKKLKEQYVNVVEYSKHYDMVIWVVDIDKMIKEDKETKKGMVSKIKEFKGYVNKLNKLDNVKIIINTPCLEYWFLLHFNDKGKYLQTCDSVVQELKKIELLKDYKKSHTYYFKYNNDIYNKLKPNLVSAIANANKLGSFDFVNPESAKAEMYKIFDILNIDITSKKYKL